MQKMKSPTKMLPKAPESDFLVSPGDIKEVRKCVLLRVTCLIKLMNPFAIFSTNTRQPSPPVVRTLVILNSLIRTLIQVSVNPYPKDCTLYP